MDDTSVVIIVNPDVVYMCQNAFTPGSDGLNDVFQIFLPPSGVDYSTFNLVVYDRWGELIYQTNDVTVSWTRLQKIIRDQSKNKMFMFKNNIPRREKHYEKSRPRLLAS